MKFMGHIDAMNDSTLLDCFEQLRSGVYWAENEYRGRTSEGWAEIGLCGVEGPPVAPSLREAMRTALIEHAWKAFFTAREDQRDSLKHSNDIN
jgi:hypothetical protein